MSLIEIIISITGIAFFVIMFGVFLWFEYLKPKPKSKIEMLLTDMEIIKEFVDCEFSSTADRLILLGWASYIYMLSRREGHKDIERVSKMLIHYIENLTKGH